MTDADLIELYEERCSILEFDGKTDAELTAMNENERKRWRRDCERAAYFDLRRLVGNVPVPEVIRERVRLGESYKDKDCGRKV